MVVVEGEYVFWSEANGDVVSGGRDCWSMGEVVPGGVFSICWCSCGLFVADESVYVGVGT